ncbi:MAG: DUF1549 and DUF1553 domain-containing protein, partial [Planctomycetota bacterium]
DLTGLTPTHQQITRFEDDVRVDKVERLVDQLLASPAFAERFGRHWLDVARYADTIGYAVANKKREIEGAYLYRDWVLNAFANDMPYDEMVMHQVAGDRTDRDNEHGNLDAMGFLTIGRRFQNRLDTTDDRIDVITRGLLGLTVACARCHDHKFDPIPTKDYYSLFGVIESSRHDEESASPLAMVDKEQVADRHVLIRGQPGRRGEKAPRQFLTALRSDDEPRFADGSGRYELAQRIATADNPLFARVMVNRVWMFLMGRPLVDSASDFGVRTEPPVVPELLEDLSVDFADDFSIKRLVRRLVLSQTYRRAAECSPDVLQRDPENRYFARGNRKRMDFETLRDSMLESCGQLVHRFGGPSVDITTDQAGNRRTIYARIDRQNLPPIFRTFDFPDPNTHSPGRYYTTVPQQSLHLLNSPLMAGMVGRMEKRYPLQSEDTALLTRDLFVQILGREPEPTELTSCIEFLEMPSVEVSDQLDPRQLWRYGLSRFDAKGPLKYPQSFEPLSVFKDQRYQPETSFPLKPPLGYASIGKESAHPPSDPRIGVTRRFISPGQGTITISGQLRHRGEQGDGIRFMICAGNDQIYKRNGKGFNSPFGPIQVEVKENQPIDFIALSGETSNHDSFVLHTTVQFRRIASDEHSNMPAVIESSSLNHFADPETLTNPVTISKVGQLIQVLLASNEFAFVD